MIDSSILRFRLRILVPLLWAAGACAAPSGAPPIAPATPSEAEWEGLAVARPEPDADAPKITVLSAEAATTGWSALGSEAGFALQELVVAGLLERTDVAFVERRRFGPAALAARRGAPVPEGRPPLGNSPGARTGIRVTWSAVGGVGRLTMTATEMETGRIGDSWSVDLPVDADPVGVSRAAVRSLVERLHPPAIPSGDPATAYRPSGVSAGAVLQFVRGVRAGDRFEWAAAGSAYRSALETAGADFEEARAALHRAARLRAGGSLAAS